MDRIPWKTQIIAIPPEGVLDTDKAIAIALFTLLIGLVPGTYTQGFLQKQYLMATIFVAMGGLFLVTNTIQIPVWLRRAVLLLFAILTFALFKQS